MRSLGERLNLLRKRLINLRCGPGAAVLPAEVSRIHMDFATKLNGGHMGARKFWREYLPRLKYHNPSVPMIVNRHDQNASNSRMTIYIREASSSSSAAATDSSAITQPASSRSNLSKAQPPAAGERVVHIDMKDKHSSHILEYFLAETRAVPTQPSPEDIAEMQKLEALKKRSDFDRERVRQMRAEKKKEEDMLKRARAAGGLAEEDAA